MMQSGTHGRGSGNPTGDKVHQVMRSRGSLVGISEGKRSFGRPRHR
jgi:hypothetical protein